MDVQREIDTRGLNCPLPILKAKKALAEMASGELLKVVATDPGSMRDFQAFARQTGNELVQQETAGTEFIGTATLRNCTSSGLASPHAAAAPASRTSGARRPRIRGCMGIAS